jgi:pyruvate carboxylase
MRLAIETVLKTGRICEGTICYTGDILNPDRSKYDLDYFVKMGRELRDMGVHILGLKDMAGLLKPASARILVKALKDETGLPIHFHTHDTSGIAASTVLAAVEAGADAVDAAMDAFSGATSQPCLGSIVEALRYTERDTGLDISAIREISDYWKQVRQGYSAFEIGVNPPASEVYLHEMPGGQYTNLRAQAASLGLADQWSDVAQKYADANLMFGDIVKVTPSSKVVGDMALMMVTQKLSREDVENPGKDMAFPASVIEMMRGNLGQPPGGWPAELQKKVLKDETPFTERPGEKLDPVDMEATRRFLKKELLGYDVDEDELTAYTIYPKVFLDYMGRRRTYGPVWSLPTPVFFWGMNVGEEISVEIDPGKVLEIRLVAIGSTREDGDVKVFFELNGQPRSIIVPDRSVQSLKTRRQKKEAGNKNQIGAPMPGAVATIAIAEGDDVRPGDLILTIEAMKMETAIHAEIGGKVKALHVQPGDQIDAKDLLVEIS